MSGIDEIEDMVDEEMHAELRDALTKILDALSKLDRENQIKILNCVRVFYGLPRSE